MENIGLSEYWSVPDENYRWTLTLYISNKYKNIENLFQ